MLWGALGAFEFGGQATGPLPFQVACAGEMSGAVNIVQGVRMTASSVGEMVGSARISTFGLGDFAETLRRPRQDRMLRRPMHEV